MGETKLNSCSNLSKPRQIRCSGAAITVPHAGLPPTGSEKEQISSIQSNILHFQACHFCPLAKRSPTTTFLAAFIFHGVESKVEKGREETGDRFILRIWGVSAAGRCCRVRGGSPIPREEGDRRTKIGQGAGEGEATTPRVS